MARPGGVGPIALRLALAFVGVALTAVALLAGLSAAFVAADVSHLVSGQQESLVLCQGQVIRCKERQKADQGVTLAAAILDYQFLHEK